MKNEGFFRRNSSCLIDKKLLIDSGAHIFSFIEDFNVPDLFDELTDIIVTHFHSDHINKESVLRLAENRSLRVGCDKRTMEHIGEHPNITYTLFKPYAEYARGDIKVTPLLSNHDIVADGENFAFNYYIETKDGKSIFYGLDSAWILRPTWEYLKKKKFDAFVFDCTVGDKDDWRIFEHNTIPMIRKMVEEINAKEMTVLKGETEKNIALTLLELPTVLNKALDSKSLNDIAEYIFNLTSLYNKFYAENKVLTEEDKADNASSFIRLG